MASPNSSYNGPAIPIGILRSPWKRITRAIPLNPLVEGPTGYHSFVRWLIPSLGGSDLQKAMVNISAELERIEDSTTDAVKALQVEVSSLSKVVLQNRMALDLLTAKEGGVCTVINQSCCTYIDQFRRIETDLEEIWRHTHLLHEVSRDDTSLGFTELWEKLTSWLPSLTRLKQLFTTGLVLLFYRIFICLIIRCFKGICAYK